MKIAILGHSLYPIKQPYAGGLEMITYILCRQLIALGHEVHLYAHKDSEPDFNVVPLSAEGLDLKNVIKYLGETAGIDENFVTQNLMYARACNMIENEGYDVVHNHSLHHLPILLGNNSKIPYITTLHTPPFPFLQMGVLSVKDAPNQTFTVVSQSAGKVWSPFIDEYEVIYNGIDIRQWHHNPEPEAKQLIWLGRICEEKAPHHAIQAAIKAGHRLWLAGPMSSEDYFNKEVKPLLEHPDITYLGHLNHEQLNDYIGKATATLFTSTWEEPYGLTIAESLACGTPVVAYDIGAAPEILNSNCGILVPRNNVDALAAAIRAVQFINRADCRERAKTFCDAAVMTSMYLRLYDSVIRKKQQKTLSNVC